jgi:hypothetical protein
VDKNIAHEVSSKYLYFGERQLTNVLKSALKDLLKKSIVQVRSDCTGSPTVVQSD